VHKLLLLTQFSEQLQKKLTQIIRHPAAKTLLYPCPPKRTSELFDKEDNDEENRELG